MLSLADTCASYTSGKLTYADVTAVLGNADFEQVGKLCSAVLAGEAGQAFEYAEAFLSAGKSVGMLLKDIMNFLNACVVAKTCRDGKSILAFPDDMYQNVAEIARGTDSHTLLRASEIFSGVEMDLKYSSSPRIVFETAVFKASMPSADYDIEALLSRISLLEKKLEEGVFVQNDGGRYATNVVTAPEAPKAEVKKEEIEMPSEEEYYMDVPPEYDAPPDEAETGGNVYFDIGFEPKLQEKTPIRKSEPIEKPQAKPMAEAKPAAKAAPIGDAKVTFGLFMRNLRKIARSGVLLTLCMDLDGVYEDGIFVLYTTSDTIYRSLQKPEHMDLIAQTFEAIGIVNGGFAVRLKGKQGDTFQKDLEEIKETFSGVKIEIK
jgi:DNA polymerase III gamma/tau subunit